MRALVVTEDPLVLDELVRLSATAGAELDVVAGAGTRTRWSSAPLVLVAADCAAALARLQLPRRAGVVLLDVGDGEDPALWRLAVALGAEHVALLPEAEDWLVGRLADVAAGLAPECPLVGVVGGRGGAGATVLAAALAVTAARTGSRALLVDADPLGGGIDLVLGGEDQAGLRWSGLTATRGRVPGEALTGALPRMAGLGVLSWDRASPCPAVPGEAMQAVLSAGRRGHDVVVVDLPRAGGEAAEVAVAAADLVLLLVPAEVRATAAAARVVASTLGAARDLRLVVRVPGASGLSGPAVAAALGLPLAGVVRTDPELDLALERGLPPARRGRGSLAEVSELLLSDLRPAVGPSL